MLKIVIEQASMPVNIRVLLSHHYSGIMLAIMVITYLAIGVFTQLKLRKGPYTMVLKSRD